MLFSVRWILPGKGLDQIDIRLLHHLQKLTCIGGERFDIAALAFGINRIKGEGRFARSRQSRQDNENPAGYRQKCLSGYVPVRRAHEYCGLLPATGRRFLKVSDQAYQHYRLRCVNVQTKRGTGIKKSGPQGRDVNCRHGPCSVWLLKQQWRESHVRKRQQGRPAGKARQGP